MHAINLEKYDIRTDLVIEKISNDNSIKSNHYEKNNVKIDDIILNDKNKLHKKKGRYITISFNDITDKNCFFNVKEMFSSELNKLMNYLKIKKDSSCLIIGLGNKKVTSDALGHKTLENIIVTRHIYLLNDIDPNYRNVSILEPNVIGDTGIESSDIILSVIKKIKPDFVIVIDSLCAMNMDRLNKTIQLTDAGIEPGSGIGNNKMELSFDTLGIPVIAIGMPSVVDSIVIVSDTIKYLIKKVEYLKENINNNVDKFKPLNKINYLNSEIKLSSEEREEILGMVGTLDDHDLKSLIFEVLSPINYNMIVTTKEIDFIVDKMGKLLGEGINETLHNI